MEWKWINGRDDEKENLWMWSYDGSRHLMEWNHQDEWKEVATWELHISQDKTKFGGEHSLTTHTKIVHNFFTIISTCKTH